jgi:transcriptional regulator with XRE-family HTH domain
VVVAATYQQRAVARRLRDEGRTWANIAGVLRERYGLDGLAAARQAHGWSQQRAADEWCRLSPDEPITQKTISGWETRAPGRTPSLRVLERLSQLYEVAASDLLAGWADFGHLDERGAGPSRYGPDVNRREWLAGAAGLGAGTALGGLGAVVSNASDRARFGGEALEFFSTQLGTHWAVDRQLGPLMLINTAVPQCATVLEAVDATRGELHRHFVELATAFTSLVAWLYQDAGDLPACSRWLGETLELAHRSGDPQLVAYGLACKAMLAIDARDGVRAVEFADAVLREPDRLTPKVQAMALQQAIAGHALLGDRHQVDRLLDQLGEQLAHPIGDHPWGGDRLRR